MGNLNYLFLLLILLFVSSCSKDENLALKHNGNNQILPRHLVLDNWTPIGPCETPSLEVFISAPCIGTEWENGIIEAMQKYNNSGSSLNFTLTTIQADAHITFNCEDFDDNSLFGLGEWPDQDGEVGGQIFLNSGELNGICANPPACFFTGVAMHEIGHNLGLGHNQFLEGSIWQVGEWQFNPDGTFTPLGGTNPGTWIEGTILPGTDDPTSVFNGGVDCDKPCVFNNDDLLALISIYGSGDCNDFNPMIEGPGALCVNEVGEFCIVDDFICSISWFGHPDINGLTTECINLTNLSSGDGYIYADVIINGCIYHLSKIIHIGPPNILDNIRVEFDPCLSLITIEILDPNPTTTYIWSEFIGLNNSPIISYGGVNNSIVTLRSLYGPGEELCFSVTATSDCGISSTPCNLCYITPDCEVGEIGESSIVLGQLSNSCDGSRLCPEGYTCIDGICCEAGIITDPCESNLDCGVGFECVNGICVSTQGDECVDSSHCPPGMRCKNGHCI